MLSRLKRRSDWRSARRVGLHRTRVDAFRVYAMLMVILGHSQFAIGSLSQQPVILSLQLFFNVVGRAAVPLFLLLAGEHLGPRLLRDRAPGAGWSYVQRLAAMFAAASVFYWIVDIAKLARRLGLGPGLAEFVARYSRDPLQILVYGARPHLWFLVVLMLVVAVAGIVLARSRVRIFVFACAALYGVGLALGPYAPLFGAPTGRIWYEWFFQSPLFFAIGVFFGLARVHVARERLAAALIVAGITMHAIEVYVLVADYGAWPFGLGMLIGTVPYTVGVGLVALSPGATRLDRVAGRYVAYVPAVYLVHVAFIEVLLPPRGQFPELAVRVLHPVVVAVLSFVSAAILARVVALFRRRRRPRVKAAMGPSATPSAP